MTELIEFKVTFSTPYGDVRRSRYKCGNCKTVFYCKNFNFCPECGTKFNRADKRTKEYKEMIRDE